MKKLFILYILLFICATTKAQSSIQKLINEGIEFHDKKQYQKAIDKYKEALKIDTNSWLANYEIAFSYFQLKDYENTIKHSEKSIKNDKNNAYYSYIILGSAYDLINKPQKAIKTYKKGIHKFPKVFLLHYNLSLTYYNLKDIKNAEPYAIKAIQLNPNHSSSHLIFHI